MSLTALKAYQELHDLLSDFIEEKDGGVPTAIVDKLAEIAGMYHARKKTENEQKMEEAYRSAAKNNHHRDGELEVDDEALISPSENGAYVMAWLWVDEETAGVIKCESCGTYYDDCGDGYCGLCPSCADKKYGDEEE